MNWVECACGNAIPYDPENDGPRVRCGNCGDDVLIVEDKIWG